MAALALAAASCFIIFAPGGTRCLAQTWAPTRIGVKDGTFVVKETGVPFTPLGVNYYRVAEVDGGKSVHATFCPGSYDRAFVEKMMADVAAAGFNTVRTFHAYHVGASGILTSPQAREIAPGYLDNVVHFLEQARAHGLHVIFSWDIWLPPSDWWASQALPNEDACDLRLAWDPEQGLNAFRLHRASVRTRANAIVALIEALRARAPGLLRVVLAWELENEVYVSAGKAPFSVRNGEFAFAGRDYDLSSDGETQALMDDVLVQWANVCADAIHQADPEALVSTGVFSFAAVGRGGPGTLSKGGMTDERVPARPLALLGSRLDYVDVHLYAWRTAQQTVSQFLERNLASVEWDAVQTKARELGKPLMCGECGVFANYLRSVPNWQAINHELGVQSLREQVAGLKAHGLAGALYWSYGNPDSTANDENPALIFHPQYGRALREAWAAQEDLTRPFTPDAGTVAVYHLDDLATGQATDAMGGPAGPMAGATATLGRFDGAGAMNGVGGWIDIPQPRNAATGNGLTIECWVKFRRGARSDAICRNMAYMMRIDGAIQAYFAIDGAWRKVIGHRGVPTARWTHLAMTYDCATKEVRTYIDGRLDAAQVPEGVTAGVLGVGSDVLRLGANTWNPEGSVLDGKLDEVRISSVARQYAPLARGPAAPIPADTNLIPNPSFEFGLRGWRADGEANTRLQWRIETTGAPQGRAFVSSTEPGRYSLITHPIIIAPGRTHTVSAMVRSDQPAKVTLALAGTGLPSEAKRPVRAQDFEVTPEWRRISLRYGVPEDWPTDRAYVAITKPAGASLSIDAVSLVAGEGEAFSQTEAQSAGVATTMPQGNLFVAGVPASLAVEVVNAGEAERRLRADWRLTNYLGKEVAGGKVFEGSVPGNGAAPGKVAIPTQDVGWFTLTFTVSQDGKRLAESQDTVNVVEPMAGRGDPLTSPLGMNTHMEREPDQHLDCNLAALSQCGVKWIRAWWGWGMAEKEPGTFDWTEFDRQFDAVHRAGMEIMPILLRYYPNYEQAWAGKMDRIQEPPYDLTQWGDFVTATVTRYRGRVKAWEVWNEPQYTMDAPTYAGVLKVTTERVRAADPDALVVGLGGDGLDFVGGVLAAGATAFDVLSHHSYAQLGRPYEQMATLAAGTEALTRQYQTSARVWHSEQGLGADGVGYIYLPDTEEQCAVTLAQSYLSALSTGVERFFWFSAQTSPTYGWGVFYEDYVPRPRLIALSGLARMLAGRGVTGRADLCEGRVACVLLDGQAGPAAAVWDLGGSLSLTLPKSQALAFRDMLGNPLGKAAGRPLLLTRGRPICVTSKGLSAAQLRDLLLQVTATPAGASFPLTATVAKTPDGRLEVRLANVSGDSVDARVRISAPELFTVPPDPVQLPDFGGHATQTVTLTPDRRPRAGAEAAVTVTIEVGDDAIREQAQTAEVHG